MAYKRRDMLRFLRVRNFALIDQLELHFQDGFNLLSGETGAGKSIIVDALGLLAGSKASAEMVRTGESRAIVEAVFEAHLKAELGRLGLDAGDLEAEMIIRREISPDDRNRVFINNQPTTVSSLRELAPSLLDIHGQHEQQSLLDHARQLDLIDAYADSARLAGKVREIFTTVEAAQPDFASRCCLCAARLRRQRRCRSPATRAGTGPLSRTRTSTSQIRTRPLGTPPQGKTRAGQYRSDGNEKR